MTDVKRKPGEDADERLKVANPLADEKGHLGDEKGEGGQADIKTDSAATSEGGKPDFTPDSESLGPDPTAQGQAAPGEG